MIATSKAHKPIIISGPSGVGKGTLIDKLKAAHPNTFATTTSHTTRSPRPGEVDGNHYFFVSQGEFLALIDKGAFVEHALFSGNRYGTSKQTVKDNVARGMMVLLDIDMQGVKAIKADPSMDVRCVFIKPPSVEQLEARLRGRGTDTEESIQQRSQQARLELEYAETGVHDKIIVNDYLEQAFEELELFVFDKQ